MVCLLLKWMEKFSPFKQVIAVQNRIRSVCQLDSGVATNSSPQIPMSFI